MNKTAIYGGSFDPPHKGHMEIITRLSEMFDRVVVVPAFVSPFKQEQKQASAEDRLNMLRLAIGGLQLPKNNVEISTCELDKGGVSYTIDTIKHLKKAGDSKAGGSIDITQENNSAALGEIALGEIAAEKAGNENGNTESCGNGAAQTQQAKPAKGKGSGKNARQKYYFVTGSESLPALHRWKSFDLLKKEVTFFIVPRDGYPMHAPDDLDMETAPLTVKDYSSSLVKAAHAFGFSKDLIDEPVFDYINEKGLYQEYFHLTEGFEAFALSEGRIKHTFSAVKAGITLAKIHGESVDKTITALTLHDIAKNAAPDLIEVRGITLSSTEGLPKDCRHAVWGADIARQFYKIEDEDIINAIRFHTTGRPAMSRLEMIIALADYAEEGRTFLGREAIFEAAKLDLQLAMRDMLQRVMTYLKETNREVFDISRQALEYYKGLKQ